MVYIVENIHRMHRIFYGVLGDPNPWVGLSSGGCFQAQPANSMSFETLLSISISVPVLFNKYTIV